MPWKFLAFLLLGWVSVASGQNASRTVTLTVDDVPVVGSTASGFRQHCWRSRIHRSLFWDYTESSANDYSPHQDLLHTEC